MANTIRYWFSYMTGTGKMETLQLASDNYADAQSRAIILARRHNNGMLYSVEYDAFSGMPVFKSGALFY